MTTFLTNGRLPDGTRVDIGVDDSGRIESLGPAQGGTADLDLEGWLVLPALGEPHAHLDKALTADLIPNPRGDLGGAIAAWAEAAATFSEEDIISRASRALDRLLVNGATAVRTHVNCSGEFGARAVTAMIEVRDRYTDLVDLQLVALPSRPLTGEDGRDNRRSLEAAITAGFDVVGGAPHLDPDGEVATRYCLDVAREARLPLDLHTDETLDPEVSLLSYLARLVIDTNFDLDVTASHCVSHGMQPESVQGDVARLAAEARIAVVTLPQTNLFLQSRTKRVATPRGLPGIQALRDAGVIVAAGADNLQDPFNTVGRGDPLETATLMVMAAHLTPDEALETVSTNVRQALGLARAGTLVGSHADLLVIDSPTIRSAVADGPGSRKVVRGGRMVAETRTHSVIHR